MEPRFDYEFDQELRKEDIEKRLNSNPVVFKRCRLKMERHDQAHASPVGEPTLCIKICGRENVGRSFPGDEVCVEILDREHCPQKGEVLNGKVVGLINRDENALIFICKMVEDDPKLVAPVNKHMTRIRTVQTSPDSGIVEIREYKNGRWVKKETERISENIMLVVKVIKWENGKTYPLGVVTKVIPECDAFKEILEIELGCENTPPPFKLQEPIEDEALSRTQLYEIFTFTIDPPEAENLDDAISVKEINSDRYQIGIHVTDVASVIPKYSEQDNFARQCGKTIYTPEKGDVNFLFSRDLRKNHLSLVPDEDRKAISLLVDVDKNTSQILNMDFDQTLIRSDRQMSYEVADGIIQKYCSGDSEPLRFSCVEECLAVACRFSEVHRKYRLEGGWLFGRRAGQSRSRVMVEELMNLYNSAAAEKLISTDVTRDLTPLRCHREPDPEQLTQFKEKYSELILMSPYFSNICGVDTDSEEEVWTNPQYENTDHNGISFNIFTSIFKKMEEFAKSKDYYNLMQLIFTDEIHPTFNPMAWEFRDIQKKAFILRSCSSVDSRLGHHDLQLNAYTWASSPMRRYLDLILQRLLHTSMSKEILKQADYTQVEINGFCQSGMDAEEKHDSLVLELNKFQFQPKDVVKLALVSQLTPQGHDFTISFPLLSNLHVIPIMYKHLKVVDQPRYNREDNSMILHWKRRVYSFRKSFKSFHLSKPMTNVTSVSSNLWKRLVHAMKQQDWINIDQCLQDMKKCKNEEKERNTSEVCLNKACHYEELTMELKLGAVVQVQLGTEFKDGFPVPVVQLLSVNQCFEVCLEHTRNPIDCFSKTVCNASKSFYESYEEYQNIWRKLCKIDTAYNALEENNSIILEDVPITWSKDETNLQGYFYLNKTQKKEWYLEFDLRNCFLCIRLRDQKPEKSEPLDLQGSLPFTWVAHAVTTKSKKEDNQDKKTKKEDNQDKIHFLITKRSIGYIPPNVCERETKFTVEVIPKKIPFLVRERVIEKLKQANDLVKNVATGKHLKQLNADAYTNISLDHVDESLNLPCLNESQKKAVEEAVRKPFTVIQGPPGTGKTVVGIHIVYQFFMKNQEFLASFKSTPGEKPSKKPAILYCGPSNKSVDIVAEQLLKLKGVLKPLRIYCDQMEMREFPYTGSDLKLCRKSLRDEKPKEELRDITLMYLVREPKNDSSEEINNFENHMDDIDVYRKRLKEAHKREIEKYDVVLCTCSTALKPEILAVMDFQQIIIDECAMATEPEAFIPLVSYSPRQIVLLGDHRQIRPIVQCALLKNMGMQQSLFERYMDLAKMLETQYRMHEDICRFPSEEFYEGKLKTGAERGPCYLLNDRGRPTAILFGHVQGKEDSLVVSTKEGNENSVANIKEAEQAVRVARLLIEQSGVKPEHITILTPYNAQVSEIKRMLEKKHLANVSVCTIMKSQGSEWPYVILSTVRSCSISAIGSGRPSKAWLGKRLGFITDPNQVNVAITRAQDGLVILGNSALLRCCELWERLLRHYCDKHCLVDPASDIKVQNTMSAAKK
ncbi:helicase with zinc finger domain 2 [Puntigrus tetrazona]|uniref:helicase with zinc finger domain 2 n=1 Tax=Puntigrus tetrazona TaxID=1606681 RepID=UPI001C894CE1|nr:helicase with zinc finger domain 2 [Puntigrus tetrazona]